MKIKQLLLIATLSAVLISCGGTKTFKGEIDPSSDIYGIVTDNHGRRIPNVVVTDGYTCTATDNNGEYQLTSGEFSTFVYLSLPAEYEVPVSDGIPCFYQSLTEGQNRYDFSLTALSGGAEKEFTLIAVADPQCRYVSQVSRFYGETVPDIAASAACSDVPCYGVALGDIGYNRADLDVSPIFPMMKEGFGRTGVPIFAVMGNHDNAVIFADEYSVAHDIDAQRFFEGIFGPVNYSFNRGDAHIVCMDDILFTAHNSYKEGFRDDQVEWLRQDLSYVPEGKLLIFCVHAPVSRNGNNNVPEVLSILSDYSPYFHVMSGHWHNINNFEKEDHYEHNQGAAMGSFWTCNICPDGTPNGYGIYRVNGNEITSWLYKGANCEADYQIRLYRGNETFTPGRDTEYNFNYTGDGDIIANVFNADSQWKVEVYEDGKYSGKMERYTGRDAWASGYLKGGEANVGHLYHYTLQNPDAQVEVRATDRFGNVYTQSYFTGNGLADYPL